MRPILGLLIWGLVASRIVLAGNDCLPDVLARLFSFSKEKSSTTQIEVSEIEPLMIGNHYIIRKKICFSGISCVVLHQKPRLFQEWSPGVMKLVKAGGRVIEDSRMRFPAFINCHGYACSIVGVPGIDSNMWVDGIASPMTENQNPLKAILSHFFTDIQSIDKKMVGELTKSRTILEGDLITFIDERGDFVHSGVLVKENGETWVLSKISENEVILSPISSIKEVYTYKTVTIYRRN